MKTLEDIKPFAELLEREQMAQLVADGFTLELHVPNHKVTVKLGGKYARVDIGDSGRYMVVLETGEIYGVKAYGVIHRGHYFGTLATIRDYQWGGYRAFKGQGEAVGQ